MDEDKEAAKRLQRESVKRTVAVLLGAAVGSMIGKANVEQRWPWAKLCMCFILKAWSDVGNCRGGNSQMRLLSKRPAKAVALEHPRLQR